MSLTRPIPKKVREDLAEDPFMRRCCISGPLCVGNIQWHHHLKFAGRRQDEKWGILPVCEYHHRKEASYKEDLDRVMVSRATEEELRPYCKATNYITLKRKYAGT